MYKNAFKCDKCPKNNGPRGCPAWWEFATVSPHGEDQMQKGCSFSQEIMLALLVGLHRGIGQATASADKSANVLTNAFSGLAELSVRRQFLIEQCDDNPN